MFFYVDEAGNSGNNLFDANQPVLTYGVLSSKTNIDLLAEGEYKRILKKLGTDAIHANKLKGEGLRGIAVDLVALQKRFDYQFNYYFIHKRSYAAAMFFDAVFDEGLNKAVKWEWYWTPMRFPVVATLANLMDDEQLKESWELRLLPRDRLDKAAPRIVQLLKSALEKVEAAPIDKRLKEILRDGLMFGIRYPLDLDFGTSIQKAMSPNAIGFQFVLTSIANRLKASKRKALGLVVDQQTEFNHTQNKTYENWAALSASFRNDKKGREWYLAHPLHADIRSDSQNVISHFPEKKIRISSSKESIGLQLTDVYLWLANRFIMNDDLPPELRWIAGTTLMSNRFDGISVEAMMARWNAFEKQLPQIEDIKPELMEKSKEWTEQHRAKVKEMRLDEIDE